MNEVLGIFFILLVGSEGLPLHPSIPHPAITRNSYLQYYEPAWYDTSALRLHRERTRRDTAFRSKDWPIVFKIRTSNKSWTVRLVRDTTLFANDATFDNTDGPIGFDTSYSYSGTVEEDESAVVQGIVTEDGLLDGSISTSAEEYYFEPVARYTLYYNSTSPLFHTIAYRISDVQEPPQPLQCISHDLHVLKFKNSSTRQHQDHITNHLTKRAVIDPRKTTCMLYLQADHQFFLRYGSEEACIEVMTRHVQKVNSIYKNTDFNQDGRMDNISFMIKRIKVHSGDVIKDPKYRYSGNYGVEKFLEIFSEEDYDAFCLAYMFTYRDFEMGTLGLAWTGDLKNAGGVCEKNGHYRGSMKSLNTGIVTLLNYGKHVPPAVSHVTLAHEIGHNFGSPHDPEQCTPYGEDGNFIMFARATSGDKPNNNRFSPCSINAINPILDSKARSSKGCFVEPQTSLCGNGVVEDGEECDCGWEEDCTDICCYPQRRYPSHKEIPCTLTPGSVCSPSQGPCCTSDCSLRFGNKCRDDNGCRDASFCDGRSPQCPPSINKPNRTICSDGLVCFMGECTGSICLAFGLEFCQCSIGAGDPPTKACELCCRLPGENQQCLSSFVWNSAPYDVPDMFAKPGTPCNNYSGYCDVFQKCREVDPSGPLATLRKLLLSDESIATFRQWIIEHWYLALLVTIFAASILAISVKLLSKTPEKKFKSVTIIHNSMTEIIRLPAEGAKGVTIHPPTVRAKLPLNKKVREKRPRHRVSKKKCIQEKSKDNKEKGKTVTFSSAEESQCKRSTDASPTRLEKCSAGILKHQQHQSKTKVNISKPREKQEAVIRSKKSYSTDPKYKVRSWLLSSQCRVVEPASKTKVDDNLKSCKRRQPTNNAVKRLANNSSGKTPGVKSLTIRKSEACKRARLQVLYKPPFNFILSIRKNGKVVQLPQATDETDGGNKDSGARPDFLAHSASEKIAKHSSFRKKKSRPFPKLKKEIVPSIVEQDLSDIHTVPSDLEVLLSESEFLFNDS